ncbi:MAG: glycoside hydrolase family 43 protein [Opitutus sp.]
MKSTFRPACLLTLLLSASVMAAVDPVAFDSFEYTGADDVFTAPLAPNQFQNPILAGFYPDPSICRVGDDYYLINSTFSYFPGIPIFHSRDLVNWKQIGHAIDRPTQFKYDGMGITRGIFAPALSHHGDTFYIVCTMVDGGGNFLLTAKNPAGPWSDPIWLKFDGIDPSLFFDDDGRAWMLNNGNPPDNKPLYQGHRAIWQQEFDLKSHQLIGPRSIIVNGGTDLAKKPVWIEGPHLYKREGWYYLCCAEGGTSDQHSQVILRSKSVTGPFEPWDQNPILTQRDLDGRAPHAITCTGHADLVIGPDGNWWSVFLACRPYAGRFFTTGRETFLLPVSWTADGWPRILPPGQRVPYIVNSPTGSTRTPGATPLTGNFTWRDDFDAPALSPLWIMLRQPHETWWRQADGKLSLTPREDVLSGKRNPSFLARRLQHAKFTATTALAVPASDHVSAGLAVFQNETHHFFVGVRRSGNAVSIFLERWNGDHAEIVATQQVDSAGAISLRLTGDETRFTFAYALRPDQWETLAANVDSMPVTVQAAGGGLHFTGAVIGLHARTE